MLLFYINFGDRNPPYPALGSNIPSARRPGQWFNFLQCRVSLPSLSLINRHGGTLRRAGWVSFTKTYSQGKWLVSHFPPTFSIIIIVPASPVFDVPASHTCCPQVPRLASPSPNTRVPMSPSPCPRPTFIYTQPHSISQLLAIFSGVDYQRTVSKYRKRKRKSLSSVHILHETWNQALIITSCQGKRKGKCKKSLIKTHV